MKNITIKVLVYPFVSMWALAYAIENISFRGWWAFPLSITIAAIWIVSFLPLINKVIEK